MLKKTNIKTTTYEAGTHMENGRRLKWYVDVLEETDRVNKIELYSIALRLEEYGFTYWLYGLQKKSLEDEDALLRIIESDLRDYKKRFFEEMYIDEWAHDHYEVPLEKYRY